MTQPVFFFDFASPNAYFAHRAVPGVERRTGVAFRYEPVLLGGIFRLSGNQPPMVAFANVPSKLAYERLESERFKRKHGIERFRMNPHFPMNTLQLMRAATAADLAGVLAPFVEAVFVATWEQELKIDDAAVLRGVLLAADLPADDLLSASQEADTKALLLSRTEAAYARGVFGLPSFLVGDELFYGKDKLGDIEMEIVRRAPAEPLAIPAAGSAGPP